MNLCCVSIYCTCITLYLCTTHVPVPLYLYPSTCTPVPVPLYPLYPLYCTPCACVVFQKIGNVFFSLIYKLKNNTHFLENNTSTGGTVDWVQVQVHVHMYRYRYMSLRYTGHMLEQPCWYTPFARPCATRMVSHDS